MALTEEIMQALKDPFPVEKIHWRIGATNAKQTGGKPTRGVPLAFVDARDVMKRLDDVMGIDGWQCNYTLGSGGLVICNLGLLLPNEKESQLVGKELYDWVWKSDGAGESDIEAEKGACSGAFKRAAVRFGVARYLYYLKNQWVDLNGHEFVPPSLPKWAYPGVFDEKVAEEDE